MSLNDCQPGLFHTCFVKLQWWETRPWVIRPIAMSLHRCPLPEWGQDTPLMLSCCLGLSLQSSCKCHWTTSTVAIQSDKLSIKTVNSCRKISMSWIHLQLWALQYINENNNTVWHLLYLYKHSHAHFYIDTWHHALYSLMRESYWHKRNVSHACTHVHVHVFMHVHACMVVNTERWLDKICTHFNQLTANTLKKRSQTINIWDEGDSTDGFQAPTKEWWE